MYFFFFYVMRVVKEVSGSHQRKYITAVDILHTL